MNTVPCVMTDYHGHVQELTSPQDAEEWFDEQAGSILPTGRSAQTIWFGPRPGTRELRIDIDVDLDRAALTWLPDGSTATATVAVQDINVLVNADGHEEHIQAGVPVSTARSAVAEYAISSTKPSSLS